MTRLLFLLPLLALAACDSASGGNTYDLSLYSGEGERVARITFERPVGDPCDAIGCGSGEAEWKATDVESGFRLSQRRGTLYAQETGFGAYRLTLTPEIADDGIHIEIEEDPRGAVTGRWSYSTLSGEVAGGAVRGTLG